MNISRRKFIVGTSGLALATSSLGSASGVFSHRPTLRVGLIGCGGRGNGAIRDTLAADPTVEIGALGDYFTDRVTGTAASLKSEFAGRYKVENNVFSGYSAYLEVIASNVDVVILTTPPGFRPIHFAAAVAAGKHVFMEKPVAVDGPGIRTVIEAAKAAKAKNLTVVAGTQRRADNAYMACMEKIHGGAIGEITQMNCYWNQGGLWINDRKPEWNDAEYQIRNWLYYTWLSGDHITEQHVHNLDVCNWVMKGHPTKATSMGGRQVRTEAQFGNIFDHFATEYEYEGGAKLMSYCRQIDGCANNVSEDVIGTKGRSNANTSIKGENAWRWQGDRPNPYVQEHKRLYASIAKADGFNEGEQVAHSTLTAIMGRMSAYSGETVTWDQAMKSPIVLMPSDLSAKLEVPAVAMPGKTKGIF